MTLLIPKVFIKVQSYRWSDVDNDWSYTSISFLNFIYLVFECIWLYVLWTCLCVYLSVSCMLRSEDNYRSQVFLSLYLVYVLVSQAWRQPSPRVDGNFGCHSRCKEIKWNKIAACLPCIYSAAPAAATVILHWHPNPAYLESTWTEDPSKNILGLKCHNRWDFWDTQPCGLSSYQALDLSWVKIAHVELCG